MSRPGDETPAVVAPPNEPEAAGERLGRWLKGGLRGSLLLFAIFTAGAIFSAFLRSEAVAVIFFFGLGGSLLFTILFAFALLLYVFAYRLQAHLLEVIVTLSASSLPMGLLLRSGLLYDYEWGWSFAMLGLLGVFGAAMVFGGSLWGLSAAKRLKEKRTWPRLGFLLLGWAMMYSVPSFLAAVFFTAECFSDRGPFPVASAAYAALFWICVALGVLAMVIEHRCRKVGGVETI